MTGYNLSIVARQQGFMVRGTAPVGSQCIESAMFKTREEAEKCRAAYDMPNHGGYEWASYYGW